MTHTIFRRIMAFAGALAVSVMAVTGVANAVDAADSLPASELGNIKADTVGSLTIHKYKEAGNTSKLSVSGTSKLPESLKDKALAGVTFKVRKINGLDVTTVDGFTKATELSGATARKLAEGAANIGGYTLEDGTEQVTDTNGEAKFENLAVGAYMVFETDAPKEVTAKSDPFLVTIPLRDAEANIWQYNVHVYPKNEIKSESTKKTDSSKTVKVGDELRWDIHTQIPVLAEGRKLTKIQIVDALPDSVQIKSLAVGIVDSKTKTTDDVTLVKDTDYMEYLPTGDTGGAASVYFTEAGLTKAQGYASQFVHVTVITTLRSLGSNNGTIVNKAYPDVTTGTSTEPVPIPPTPDSPPTVPPDTPDTPGYVPPTPSDPTYVGKLKITKVDSTNQSKKLKGAKFQIFPAKADGTYSDQPVQGDGGKNYFETNEQGEILVELSLHESNTGKFKVVETEAPAGFVTPQGDNATTEVTLSAGDVASTNYKTITNVPDNGVVPNLPLTGATGRVVMLFAGMAMIAGAGIAAMRRMRARH